MKPSSTALAPAAAAGSSRSKSRVSVGKLAMTLLMIAAGLLMILPFAWMISTSFKSPSEVFQYPVSWIPKAPSLQHHLKVWTGEDSFVRYYYNSLKIAVICTIGATFLAAFAAYGFARTQFKGRNQLFMLYLSMMMVPPQVLFVPKFILFDKIGIYNTHLALILPGLFSIFGVFLLRQFFMSIPNDITESAFIDGAGHFRIFFRLLVPLAKPAIATLAILDFSWMWNDYENALVFLLDRELYTVPLGMQNFILEFNVDYNGMMAATSASIVPMIVVFLLGQRYIIQGITGSAVKG
ncbi:carbohydrate ABC transporter permease [Paenibacillus herberti]|uniref:Sugar ABC transporter ATP-binding protein n=1 Tax=Paenibacillus herberti TaxID=1619309 RepID=A0A229P4R4_9BACL|nr:sugar ABC transporter ATP-binding protein [Paenibacillus herberti]